jgi:hypothetical protein
MLRSSLYVLGALTLGTTAVAQQQDASARLRTVPNPPIEITYDMRTKTLTADHGAGAFFGPDVLYANTCPSGFFIGLSAGDQITDEGQLPAPNDGVLAGAGGAGCSTVYTVNGFQVAYCSNQAANDLAVSFHSLYNPCTDINGASPGVAFLIGGLPGSTTGGAICYALTIDLMGTSFEFTLVGSGDGTWDGNTDHFGYTYEFTNLTGTAVGAIIAGGPVFLGTGCDFLVGTVFEVQDPTGTNPEGTGYFQGDQFGLMQAGTFAGCFFFGGWPAEIWSGFHLRLHSGDAMCTNDPLTPTCAGDGSYPSNDAQICPCGNTSTPGNNEGCLNVTGSGGTLRAPNSGTSVSGNDLVAVATHPPGAGNGGLLLVNSSIFATGNANWIAGTPAEDYEGMACVGGGPRILAGAGDPAGSRTLSNIIGATNTIAPGFMSAGNTYFLQYWHRDVVAPGGPCPDLPGAGSDANFTNAGSVTLTP